MRAILEEAARQRRGAGHARARKIGDLYAAFMDEDARRGARARRRSRADLDAGRAAADQAALRRALAACSAAASRGAVRLYVNTDDRRLHPLHRPPRARAGSACPTSRTTATTRSPRSATAYVAHVARMLDARRAEPTPSRRRRAVMALETRLAAGALGPRRRPRRRRRPTTCTTARRAATRAPGFDWDAVARRRSGRRRAALAEVVVRQPDLPRGAVARRSTSVPLEDWKAWLALARRAAAARRTCRRRSSSENFAFYGRTLHRHAGAARALEARRRRWWRARSARRSARSTSRGTSRRRPRQRMDDARRQPGRGLPRATSSRSTGWAPRPGSAPWRSSTQVHAQDRLPRQVARLLRAGDRAATTCSATSARGAAFETDRELAKLGEPVDRDEWLMTPQTVNAYYNPGMNEIVFPAAILQPPFFDPDADDAVNYGGDRRGDRPRDRPRVRRPGLAVRRRRQPAATGGPTTTAREFERARRRR